MAEMEKVRFVCSGYYHPDLRMWYRYKDADGKLYDLYEDEVYRFLHPTGNDVDVYVDPSFMDIFAMREIGDYNYHGKRWNWKYE